MRYSYVLAFIALAGCPNHIPLIDADGDGYYVEFGDCDDSDASVHPNESDGDTDTANDLPVALEIPCDGIDNDCEGGDDEDGVERGFWYPDKDADGFGDGSVPLEGCEVYGVEGLVVDGTDCDDTDSDINPSTPDIPGDGVDRDCDGKVTDVVAADADGDGFDELVDCDDSDATVNPDADEVCDLIDNDCDGLADDEDDSVSGGDVFFKDTDQDGYGLSNKANQITACEVPDGYASVGSDCDDGDSAVHPGAAETCTDFTDQNCDGAFGAEDNDGDGVFACEECDDFNDAVYPGATEVCNGVDDNCDVQIDEGVLTTWYQDTDKDLYGSELVTKDSCSAPTGFVPDGGDCDDARPAVNPDESEVCDDRDNNCDGVIDEGVLQTFYKDTDQDGYGGTSTTEACTPPTGYVANKDDCNDTNKNINPNASEVCDAVDNDCDGTIDIGATDAKVWFADSDKDGYGGKTSTTACAAPAGYVSDSKDCDDSSALISPVGTEVCNGKDDDCDTVIDDGATGSAKYYLDADKDGYGDSTKSVSQCSPPVGYVLDATDCDDAKSGVNPAKTEVCNGVDDDCEGGIDEGVKSTFYADTDGDKYGNVLVTTLACSLPVGFSANSTDCDDTKGTVNPAATEVCNGADDDCDLAVDEGVQVTFYKDGDDDKYGDVSSSTKACAAPLGYVPSSTDCKDDDKTVNPGASEVCNGKDDNCNVLVDDGAPGTAWYQDADKDGYGGKTSTTACAAPAGYVAASTDCDDRAPFVHPGVVESPATASDDDCDGKFAHTDGVSKYTVNGTSTKLSFTGGNLVTDSCGVTMGCGTLGGWEVKHFTAEQYMTYSAPTGPLAFTTTLSSTRSAVQFDSTGGNGFIEDECRSYRFPAAVGNTYGITFDFTNRSPGTAIVRIYRLTDYSLDRASAIQLNTVASVPTNTDDLMAAYLTAGSTTEGFVLCAGGVTTKDAVGFTEVWIGPVTVQ